MKRIKRITCILIILSIIMAIPVYATEQTPRASHYFSSYNAYCHKSSSTNMRVYFTVIATSYMDELGVNSIEVQRSSDGTNWTTVKTYTKASYPEMKDTDTAVHAGYVSYTATPGYYYRAFVEFYAKNSTGTGYLYYYTDKI